MTTCVECGSDAPLVGVLGPGRRRGLRRACRDAFRLSPEGLAGIERLLSTPLADAAGAGLSRARAARCARGRHLVVRGARRIPAADAVGVTKRELGDGLELDDDTARIDLAEVHRFICEESYWAAGRARETQDG